IDYPLYFCWQSGAGTYNAQTQVASFVFYEQVTTSFPVAPNRVLTFVGHAGGLSWLGGQSSWGSLITDDVLRLYRDTVSFAFNAAVAYFNVNFFDGNSNLLGSYHGGGIGLVTGIGGGTGHWSR